MSKSNVKQHYIPEYYLKNFADNGSLHIYDIKTKSRFTNSISNTAYKKNFYNVNPRVLNRLIVDEKIEKEDFIDDIINKFNESILAEFFDSFNPTRDRILQKDNRKTISVIDFHSLVDFILVQTYRNPKFSLFFKAVDDIAKKKYKADESIEYDKTLRGIVILQLFNELHYGRNTRFRDGISDDFRLIFDELKTMKELVTDSYKIVYWNKTSIDFLTSDCAMSHIRLCDSDLFTSIFVPINTKIAVLLVNKNSMLFDSRIKDNATIIHLEEEDVSQVEAHNLSIIEKANRFVYSINGGFPSTINTVSYKEWWNM